MKHKIRELIKNRKGLAVLLSAGLVLLVGVQATMAFLVAGTPSYVNTFKPATYVQGTLSIAKSVQHPLGADYVYPRDLAFEFEVRFENMTESQPTEEYAGSQENLLDDAEDGSAMEQPSVSEPETDGMEPPAEGNAVMDNVAEPDVVVEPDTSVEPDGAADVVTSEIAKTNFTGAEVSGGEAGGTEGSVSEPAGETQGSEGQSDAVPGNESQNSESQNDETLNNESQGNEAPDDELLNNDSQSNESQDDESLSDDSQNNESQNDEALNNNSQNNEGQNDEALNNNSQNNEGQNNKPQDEEQATKEEDSENSYVNRTFKAVRILGEERTEDEVTTDENGVLLITLKPGEQIDIEGVDAYTRVTVTELSAMPGFRVNGDEPVQIIEIGEDGETVEFINIYEPAPAIGDNISITARKILQGRDWKHSDVFVIQMEYDQGNGSWIDYGKRMIDYDVYDDSSARVDFNDIIEDMPFDKVGEYHFRLSEVKPEHPLEYMTYDDTVYEFAVTVGDEDMDGSLEIQNVAAVVDEDETEETDFVRATEDDYRINVAFTNIYDKPGDDPDDPDDPDTPDDPVDPDKPGEDEGDTPQGGKVPAALNGDDHVAYVFGYPDGTVRPEREITRAEVATIFYRLLKDDVREQYRTDTCSFSDVKRGAWYDTEVATMANMGIIGGYPDGTFKPDAPITRAEFTAMASRFDKQGVTDEVIFQDIEGHWAELAIELSANNNWVMGYEDGTFRPDRNISRAEAMAIMNRILCRQPETLEDLHPDMIHWPDNDDTGMWYYVTVQEATNGHEYEWKDEKHETWTELKNTKEKESFLERFLKWFRS